VATGGKWPAVGNGSDRPKPLPWVAIGCRRSSMVRRASTVRVRQRASKNDLLVQVVRRLRRKRIGAGGYQTGTGASPPPLVNGLFSSRSVALGHAFDFTSHPAAAASGSSPNQNPDLRHEPSSARALKRLAGARRAPQLRGAALALWLVRKAISPSWEAEPTSATEKLEWPPAPPGTHQF
jgi:hypothetical protein